MIIHTKKKRLTSPEEVYKILKSVLEMENEVDRDKEHFWAIGLGSRNDIKYIDLVSLGTLNANLVHPREVFRLAVMKGVASVLVVHNHPSGDPNPSEDDLTITARLTKAGKILGVDVVDHIIIAGEKFISFKDEGLIKEEEK